MKWKPNMVCIQETKMVKLSMKDVENLGFENKLRASFKAATWLLGGLLTMWDESLFELLNCGKKDHWLGVSLKVRNLGEIIHIFNIYSP